jgi:hypothetical protein
VSVGYELAGTDPDLRSVARDEVIYKIKATAGNAPEGQVSQPQISERIERLNMNMCNVIEGIYPKPTSGGQT